MAVTSTNPEVDSSVSSSSVFENVGSFVSSFFPVARNQEEEEEESSEEEPKEEAEGGEEGGEDEEEEEEDEPEDVRDEIYASCEESKACAPAKHHFDECQTRVQEGKGYKGEDCIEEFFHLAHCAQECLAPKLFSKLV